jgi:hypothetical protein
MRTKDGRKEMLLALLTVVLLPQSASMAFSQPEGKTSSKTQIVLLGTGTPGFDINRFGPATAIVVNGTPYLIDFGAGVMRRAEAAYEKGVAALEPPNIKIAFLTHFHPDNTIGYPDLIYSPNEWRKGAPQCTARRASSI